MIVVIGVIHCASPVALLGDVAIHADGIGNKVRRASGLTDTEWNT